jgi:hypothetical protein
MTNEDYSKVPPPELVQQWTREYDRMDPRPNIEPFIATRAAQWGADQELEACIAWFDRHIPGYELVADRLRAARRPAPKPPEIIEVDGFTYRLVQ